MADPKISIQIAAIDAFTATINDLQRSLRGIQNDLKSSVAGDGSGGNAVKGLNATADAAKSAGKEVSALGGITKDIGTLMSAVFAAGSIGTFIQQAIAASVSMDAIIAKLKVATGSQQNAADAMQFVSQTSKRLGLDLKSTAESYAAFAVATKGTTLEGARAQAIFESLSTAAAALKMPAESTARTFAQFQQMIAKGKVSMEDLKTASESGIVTFQQVADALGITTTELFKQMEAGTLMTNDVLPKLSAFWDKTFGAEAQNAAKGTAGQINRLKSELYELMVIVGESLAPVVKGIQWVTTQIKAAIGSYMGLAATIGLIFNAMRIGLDTTLSMEEKSKQLKLAKQAYDEVLDDIYQKFVMSGDEYTALQKKQTKETEAQANQRRAMARKIGEDLAKINLDYFKTAGNGEMELTALSEKQYQERIKDAQAYFDQKKAWAKNSDEEVGWEKAKKAALKKLQEQHARDNEIIQAQMVQRAVDLRKEGLDYEIALIKKAAADHTITNEQAEQRITALTVASLRDQYEVRRNVAEKIAGIYGKDSEEYKKALKEQQSSHKAYLDASTAAYKKYSDDIKAMDQQIADFRMSIQQKIADLQQRGMTESAKYADNQKRFDEAVSKSREARDKGDLETAQKYFKQSEELASRLVEKKAQTNTALQELEKDHQKKVAEIQTAAIGQQTDQQKKSAELAKENTEFEAKRSQLLKEQAATGEGITNATKALNIVEELGVSIMEKKKSESVDALAKLKEIEALKLDPKNLEVNLDDSALSRTKATMSDLTKTETKTIVVEMITPSGLANSAKGYFTGGKVASGSPNHDSVNAVLARDEWIINNRATRFLGDNFMAAVNSLNIPRMAELLPRVDMPGMAMAGAGNMGTINLQIGDGVYPVQAKVNVLSELTTAVRRMRKAGIQ